MKLCFNRRNKTLNSLFHTRAINEMMERNFRTYSSLKGIVRARAGRALAHARAHARCAPQPLPDELPDMRGLIDEVLQGGGFGTLRPAKMTMDHFLALLKAFNDKGLHFMP